MALDQAIELAPGADETGQQIGEIQLIDPAVDDRESARERAAFAFRRLFQHFLLGLSQELGAAAFVQKLEMGRDPGLEGKTAQQRLAEGMDGHDPHAAGRIEDPGEQATG